MRHALLAALLLASSAGVLMADQTLVNVQFHLQVIALPERLAVPLIPDLSDEGKVVAARGKLMKRLAEGEARLVAWTVLETKSGQRAIAEDLREIRYATEFKAGEVHVNLEVSEAADEEPREIKVKPKIEAAGLQPAPSAFETRNTGVTLEIEPVVGPDGITIDINLVPQHVWLHAYHDVTMKHDGKTVVVQQPEFRTNKVTTSITMMSGQTTLLGVFSQSERAGDMELFLLHVEVKKVD